MVDVPTSWNNLKTKVDDLDVAKLKTIPKDLKKLSDVVDSKAVKNTKFNTLKTNVWWKKITKENFWCNDFNSHKSIQHRKTKLREKKLEMLLKKY